jgi:hypothetical protein
MIALAAPAQAQQWAAYSPTGAGFTVDMPGQWTTEGRDVQTDVGVIKMNMATVDQTSQVYMTIYSIFPEQHINNTPHEVLLNNARDGAVKNVNGTLVKEDKLSIGGFPARHLTVDTSAGRVSQRLILAGTRLLQAIYVGPAGNETTADVGRFFQSFQVTGPLDAGKLP